ncbi:MAG: type IV pilus modification PilV family protein, partial [Pyrinomonadaceae bacterium]
MATEIRRKGDGQSGFSLVECMIAMLITIVGVLAVEALIVNAITMQKFSRESTEAIALARAAVEEMGARPRAARAVGGDLNSNVNNYFDTVNE